MRIRSPRQSQSYSSISSSGDPDTIAFKMQAGENLMKCKPTMSCVVHYVARDCSGVILIDLCKTVDNLI